MNVYMFYVHQVWHKRIASEKQISIVEYLKYGYNW